MAEDPLPEQTFFADPMLDRVLGVAMTLAAEVWVLRERQRALEAVLAERGVVPAGTLDTRAPDAAEAEATARDRDAFVQHLMQNLLGQQVSRGATPELLARHGIAPES